MNSEELAAIKARCEAATKFCDEAPENDAIRGSYRREHWRAKWADHYGLSVAEDIPALLAEIERLQEENEWLEEEADGYMCAESYTAWERDEAEAEVERLRELLREATSDRPSEVGSG